VLAGARARLSAEEEAHLQRLQAAWGMLADLCFGDLVLYLPHPAGTFVIANHVRPTTAQTIYHSDLVGEVRTAEQRPLVAAACETAAITTGEIESAWLGERVRVQAIPVVGARRVLAVLARESAVSVRSRPGELERTYLALFDRFAAMIAAGRFPYPDESTHLTHAPRVGDGVVVLGEAGSVEYASPNANSTLTRAGVDGPLLGRTLGDAGFDPAAVRQALVGGRPAVEELDTERGTTVAVRALPLRVEERTEGVVVLLRDVTDLRARDRLLLSKEATIREIHHRVKNNLQTISSLLRLQGRRLTEPSAKAAIDESVRRIRSIALVHEALSRDAGDDVAVVAVLRPLIRMVEEGLVSPEAPVRFELVGDGVVVTAPIATGLSVVVTELLQNAVEHAFPPARPEGRPSPTVVVSVRRAGDELVVTVEDNGVGLPPDQDLASSTSLGISIVRTMVESEMRGRLSFRSAGAADAPGTVVELVVPLDPPER